MGFTWTAGFLAAFTEVAALWWVYIVLNGLQGTFIAFSFVLNARLIRFLKNKMSDKTSGMSGIDSKSRTAAGSVWRMPAASSQHVVQRQHVQGACSAPSDCTDLGTCLDSQKEDANGSFSAASVTLETNVDTSSEYM